MTTVLEEMLWNMCIQVDGLLVTTNIFDPSLNTHQIQAPCVFTILIEYRPPPYHNPFV